MQSTTVALRRPAWIDALFATIDAKDASAFAEYLTQDGQFRFGNAPPAIGRNDIRAMVAGFFASIKGLSHQLAGAWVLPDHVFCHGTVTYTRLNGSQLAVPFATVFAMSGEQVKDYRIFMDASQLYA